MGLFTRKAPNHLKSDWSGLRRSYSKSYSSESDIEKWSIDHILMNLYVITGTLEAIPEMLEDCESRVGTMHVVESNLDYVVKMIKILNKKVDEEKAKKWQDQQTTLVK